MKEKVLNSFSLVKRNLGVILSGDKGIGKSLFSKVLAQKAIKQGYPLIIVNSYFPGIAEFLNTIQQEVMVLFDEFDKTFPNSNDGDAQAEMLTLFDGITQGKKLFCITCNSLVGISSFLVNRPGRFHYHFRFDYPTPEEVREYLHDKLTLDEDTAATEIEKVVHFSRRTNVNFDCLRAIAFELNLGLTFEEAIKDLNILQTGGERFNLKLRFDDGSYLYTRDIGFDPFSDLDARCMLRDPQSKNDVFTCTFTPTNTVWNNALGISIIRAEDLELTLERYIQYAVEQAQEDEKDLNDMDKENLKIYNRFKDLKPIYLELHRVMEKGIHYSL